MRRSGASEEAAPVLGLELELEAATVGFALDLAKIAANFDPEVDTVHLVQRSSSSSSPCAPSPTSTSSVRPLLMLL